ncbi:unnamed protein product [Rotaria sp. Silwood2]|nr:unnamed protein product [Rotaria sp. Silwood2]CAF2733296.1 unnamed protein product [Rotaria sp. Silwood2]CAF3007215.1 unnamed protein product [Rotaria sp. Silwood2]CAF3149180.1 unnamed protein product [Rotaria sp. Silwood2]CAF3865257.1 unnamed protein product [Rotaria sp. Silwood2]
MSQKHTLINKRERERILETEISENDLIAGIHETTRGLECIIIATEGLWQVLQYDIVADVVTQCLLTHHMPASSRMETAIRSVVLERYGTVTHTPYLTNDDDTIADLQCSEDDIHQEIWNSLSVQHRLRLELA